MNINNTISLLMAMVILAMTPDTSVIVVIGRSLSGGWKSGITVILGLLCGDLIFILIAVYGLSTIAQNINDVFVIIKYLAAIYLFYLGIQNFIHSNNKVEIKPVEENNLSWQGNFTIGLLITISDPKAILFYVSFLPAFVDLASISWSDIFIIFGCACVALGGVKLTYAYLAQKMVKLLRSSQLSTLTNYLASIILIATSIILFFS